MSEPSTTAPRLSVWGLSAWDVAAALVAAGVAAAHAAFILGDGRLPTDLGLMYRALPDCFFAFADLPRGLVVLVGELAQPTGWINVARAAAMSVLGRTSEVFAADGVLWMPLLLLGTGVVARRLGGPAAGFGAVALTGAMTPVICAARQSWIHVPEAALMMLAVALWTSDEALEKQRTRAGLAVLGGLAITLRASGLVWVATLAPFLLRAPRPRQLWIGVVWAAAAVVPLLQLPEYLSAKLGARARYAEALPGLWEQLAGLFGTPALSVLLPGLALLVWRRPRAMPAVGWLLAGWVGIALLLWGVFRAGLDNFTVICPAVAVGAAWGLARVKAQVNAVAVLPFALAFLPQWLPSQTMRSLTGMPGVTDRFVNPHPRNHYRTWDGYGGEDVRGLLDSVCPATGRCRVAVDQGLFAPYTEDPGALELFLLGASDVDLINLREPRPLPDLRIDAAVRFHCPGDLEEKWRLRHPASEAAREGLISGRGMQTVWAREFGVHCFVLWMTPDGAVRAPSRLPTTGERVDPAAGEWEPPQQQPLPVREEDAPWPRAPQPELPPRPGDPPLGEPGMRPPRPGDPPIGGTREPQSSLEGGRRPPLPDDLINDERASDGRLPRLPGDPPLPGAPRPPEAP